MKQLIPQQKIDEATKEYSSKLRIYAPMYHLTRDDFEKPFNVGVQFALKEIEPIIIEFADFTRSLNKTTNGEWIYDCKFFTTEQLLEQFLKTKTE